jgi:hypothetical protein
MTIGEVKKALNRTVRFRGAEYILTGCMLRKDKKTQQFFYQAELLDTTTNNSIVIARLEEVHI